MLSVIVILTIALTPMPAQFDTASFDVDTFAPEDQVKEVGVWDKSKWD